jgi:2-polyprenyl-6-methoxyphenol hydroxylase-like FAD-dependent oxidoreductase
MGYVTAAFHARDYPHRDEGCYVSFSIPGGQVARYALRDGWSAFFFLFKTPGAGAQALREAQAQRAFLEETFHGRGWECDEILRALERADDLYFDEVAQAHVPQWSRGRVALIGDAAYCPSLLAGEGSGMAVAGAYVLAASLARHTQPEHAFAEYENAFRPFAARKQNSAARFASWFAPSSRVGIWVRNIFTMMLNVPGLGVRLANGVLNDDLTLPELRAKSSNPH